MPSNETQYAIIGGGIAGASIAYHLSEKTDGSITVYDRRSVASETTAKSMALLGRQGDSTIYEMKGYALELYNTFLAEPRTDSKFHLLGSVGVATTQDGAETLAKSVADTDDRTYDSLVTGAHQAPTEYVPKEEVKRSIVCPYLNTESITGALYRPKIGYTLARELSREFLIRAKESGVRVEQNTPVEDIVVEDGSVTKIETETGRVDVEHVICAAGPWNPRMAEKIGLDLPVRHTLAPILKLQPHRELSHTIPHVKHYESRVYFRGCEDGTVFVGRNPNEITPFEDAIQYDPDTVEDEVAPSIRRQAEDVMEDLYPFLLDADTIDQWVGIRSMTPDGLPIVGRTPIDGFLIAAFHSSGINLAPAVGRVIAQQLLDGDPTRHSDALSITRFDELYN